jgi:2-polyprenyl-6-methoxyphenol hydroxylase-like FAD-dependent oxidoreductase
MSAADPLTIQTPSERRCEVPVLIVGAGPVGLSMGLLLGRFGIPALIVERNTVTTDHPKARGCFARTMEIFRVWGVDESIRGRGLPHGADHWAVGHTLADLRGTRPEPDPGQTPVWKSIVAQDAVEEELLKAVQRYASTELRFDTECVGFDQDAGGVTARSVHSQSGIETEIRCQYLIACDGAGSRMRRIAGVPMSGIPSMGYMANDYLRVDLSDFAVARAAAGMLLAPLDAGDSWLTLLNTDGRDRWLVFTKIGMEKDERDRVPTDAEVVANAKRRLGVDRAVEVINRSTWRSAREVAERYREGRVFLAGDAAHRFLPTGGQGMNTGIADAHNLAWKLAFSLTGAMDPSVLDTYDIERRPVGNNTADFQVRTGKRLNAVQERIDLADDDSFAFWTHELEKHVKSVGLTLGQWYPEGVLLADETTPPHFDPERYTPVDRPGHRFPHVWIDAASTESTIDWFDCAFVLVTGPLAEEWRAAGATMAADMVAPLAIKTIDAPDRERGIMIGKHGAVLVRPDGYVAWRCAWRSADAVAELRNVLIALGVHLKHG